MNADQGSRDGIEGWAFVSSRALVSAFGPDAKKGASWAGLITTNREFAAPGKGVVVGVTARDEYPPLLHIAQSPQGMPDDYNPAGLTHIDMLMLVPPRFQIAVAAESDRLIAEEKRLHELENARQVEAAQWEAGREARGKLAEERKLQVAMILAAVIEKAQKYRVPPEDALNEDLSTNWIYTALLKHTGNGELQRSEIEQLKSRKYLYFASAAYWDSWAARGDPWDALAACSLLRRTNDHKKALRLSGSLLTSGWSGKELSALLTTRGGALRDVADSLQAWSCGQRAIQANSDSPHSYMLLGALCYDDNRREEGDQHFRSARERGATDTQIESIKRPVKIPNI